MNQPLYIIHNQLGFSKKQVRLKTHFQSKQESATGAFVHIKLIKKVSVDLINHKIYPRTTSLVKHTLTHGITSLLIIITFHSNNPIPS